MNLPGIPRLYTALAEWLGCLTYILLCKRQLSRWRLAGACAAALALQCGLQLLAGSLSLSWWIAGMAANAALMLAVIWFACGCGWQDALYCTVRAFTVAEFAAALEWQLYCFFFYRGSAQPYAPHALALLAAVYAGCFAVVALLERRHFPRERRLAVTLRETGSAVLIALSVFLISNISFVWPNTPFSVQQQQGIFYIRTLVDLCGIILLYTQQEQRSLAAARYELDAIHNILHRQYDQYRQNKQSIDLINRKYHDLKHQIAVIRAEQDPGKREAYLDEMESGIRHVEAQNKTGNSVLDTLLTGASLRCAQKDITLTAVAEGALLDFVDAMDLCTIFGNALDNAIESTEKVPDKDKRLIRLAVFRQNEFVLIRLENYCEAAPTFVDGLPATTKRDKAYHGFGVKSMRLAAEKYGGSLTLHVEDSWFKLRLLLPLPKTAPARPAR